MTVLTLNKQTYQDFRHQISDIGIGWVIDHDDTYLYTEYWDSTAQATKIKRYPYTYTDGKVVCDKNAGEAVLRDTNYIQDVTPVEKELGVIKSLLNKLLSPKTPIIKQFDDKAQTVIEPLYIAYGEVDGHGDGYKNEEAVHNLVKAFNEGVEAGSVQPSLFHSHATKTFSIGEAWVTTEKSMLGGKEIPALQPLVKIHFNSSKALKARQEGRLTGLSIGAIGQVEFVKGMLEDLLGAVKPVRLLSNFSLLHKAAHLAYTDPSVGGAASLKNDIFEIEKSMELNEHQKALLEDFDEEYVELQKKLETSACNQDQAPSTSQEAVIAGVDNKTLNKGKDTDMSNQEVNTVELELRKQIAVLTAEKELSKYSFDTDIVKSLAEALVDVTDKAPVLKAFDVLMDRVGQVNDEKVAVEKALADKKPAATSKLEKAFAKEVGEGDASDSATAPDLASILKQYRELDRKNS